VIGNKYKRDPSQIHIMEAGAIGIDIGSQNTVIAVVKNRGVEVVTSDSGHVTP